MNLDLNSLGTFSRLASTGAIRASASLSALMLPRAWHAVMRPLLRPLIPPA